MGCLDFFFTLSSSTSSSSSDGHVPSSATVSIGAYRVRLGRSLGSGGFAIVQEGTEVQSGETFAVKRIRVLDEPKLQRFASREIDALRRFASNMHIVNLLGSTMVCDELPGEALLLLPLFSQGSLRDCLAKKSISPADALHAFADTCSAVQALHSHDPVYAHRDLKPENVLLDPARPSALCDFGSIAIARRLIETREQALQIHDEIEELTSLSYRAPEFFEMVKGVALSEASDIWSLGCLLFACASDAGAENPFERCAIEQGGSLELAIQNGSYSLDEHAILPSFPAREQVVKLIADCLNLEAEIRPNIGQVRKRMEAILNKVDEDD